MLTNPFSTFRRLLLALLLFGANSVAAQDTLRFSVSTSQGHQAISPFIYGTNDNYPHAASKRLGGNRLTGYNWENNASNAGFDYIYNSDEYVPWQQGVPDSLQGRPASAISFFHNKSIAQGAYSLVTLPMAGYVAADKAGPVAESEAAPSGRWRQVRYRKEAPYVLSPDVTDSFVYIDEALHFLLHQYGNSAAPTGIRGYSLDNEPCLWFHSHSRLFGHDHVRVQYLMDQSIELARLIKEMDGGAEVFGPALYGFNAYLNLQFAPDWDSVRGNHQLFIEYYLAEMKRQEGLAGKRLLDVLDLHWYPEFNYTSGSSPFSNATDVATNKARMDMTRSLWDSAYVENTWIGNEHRASILPLLPKLKGYIDQHYPGTKLAITEYSYMGTTHASGGIAQADALGIFGKQGLYLATYWGGVSGYIKSGFDIYRNYDGAGSSFGNTAVEARAANIEMSSVYAAIKDSNEAALQVIAINKDQSASRPARFEITGGKVFKGARVWAFDNTGGAIRRLPDVRIITGNSFTYNLPPLSVCHFIFTEEDLSVHPYIESAVITPATGWSDGLATAAITVQVSDADSNITVATVDLSPLGGAANTPLMRSGDLYTVSHPVPAGTASGLARLLVQVADADGHTAQSTLFYRVIKKLPPEKIWDGDLLNEGEGFKYHDPGDSQAAQLVIEKRGTGGNEEAGSLFIHAGHDPNRWNVFAFRFAPNPAQPKDLSEFGFLEFYIRSTAAAATDIELSLQDVSAAQSNSASVKLKGDGYLAAFSAAAYTKVQVPLSAFTGGSAFDLSKTWQLNFLINTAASPFDIWIDDVRAVPFSNPAHQPVIADARATPSATYADGETEVTVSATVLDPDGDLHTVTVDLSPLNGGNTVLMQRVGSRYVATYTLPAGIVPGKSGLRISAKDSGNNENAATVAFAVYRTATTDTAWNGDSKPFGLPWVNNDSTKCLQLDSNGHTQRGSMRIHLQPVPGVPWSGIVWDWNEATNNGNLQDAVDKRYLKFYIKTGQVPPGFELQVALKDVFAESSRTVNLIGGGYLSEFSGSYQLVTIPLADLFDLTRADRSKLARFVLIANLLPEAGVDLTIDDITFSGSLVADVALSAQNASCGANGKIVMGAIQGGTGNYAYRVNGVSDVSGAGTFDGLGPGNYTVKIIGDGGFVYREEVTVKGADSLQAVVSVSGNDIALFLQNGSGQYRFLWSTGDTTQHLHSVANGSYTVAVTDRVSGCAVSSQAFVGRVLPLKLLSFVALAGKEVVLRWTVTDEINVSGYEVMHSVDGVHFTTVSRQAAKGPGAALYHYEALHHLPAPGRNFYRLRWTDVDGSVSYSPVRMTLVSGVPDKPLIFPNPAKEALCIQADSPVSAISVTNSAGQVVQQMKGVHAPLVRIPTIALPAGVYLLKFYVKGQPFYHRFVKK